MIKDSRACFVNYAHSGASEYVPENTFASFYMGICMKANGIETDVQMTKDGILVLFHDDTITRMTGAGGSVSDYTLQELKQFTLEKNGVTDKIVIFEEFLSQLGWRDIVFAIEIKQSGIERQVVDMMRKYNVCGKSVVTSFMLHSIRKVKEYAPDVRVGYLTEEVDDKLLMQLKEIRAEELCPPASEVTAERVALWHQEGFNVRAWGVYNEVLMRNVYDCKADGMTVNFPDKLTEYIAECEKQ